MWTVDLSNTTAVREAVRAILRTEVANTMILLFHYILYRYMSQHSKVMWWLLQVTPFTPREFTYEGMLERVHAYVTHQVPYLVDEN